MFGFKCVPILGTLFTLGEALSAIKDGDRERLVVKTCQTFVSGSLDAAFIVSAGTFSIAGILGKKVLDKVVVQQASKITTNIAARAACEFVADKASDDSVRGSTPITIELKLSPSIPNQSIFPKQPSIQKQQCTRKQSDFQIVTKKKTGLEIFGPQRENLAKYFKQQISPLKKFIKIAHNYEKDPKRYKCVTPKSEESDDCFLLVKTILFFINPIVVGRQLQNSTLTGILNGNIVQANDSSPVIEYSMRENGTAEYLLAEIRQSHLDKGENTAANQVLATRITQEFGDGGDHAGHILGNQFGGLMRSYNLFPQNPSINTGNWRAEYEMPMRLWLENGGEGANIQFQMRLIYQDDQATRPVGYYYLIIFRVADRIANTNEVFDATNQVESIMFGEPIPNPPSNVHITRDGEEDYKEEIRENKNKASENVKRRKK